MKGVIKKESGNYFYKIKDYKGAIKKYQEALTFCIGELE